MKRIRIFFLVDFSFDADRNVIDFKLIFIVLYLDLQYFEAIILDSDCFINYSQLMVLGCLRGQQISYWPLLSDAIG